MKKKFLFIVLVLVIAANAVGSVTFILPDLTGSNGSQITVPVKVKDFQNIVSAQGTIQFDPAIVTYSSAQQFGLPGMNASSFGTSQVSSGKLTFSWYDGTLIGVSLADSTTIFSITFNIIGTNAQVSSLTFVSTPTLIEVVDNNFNTLTTVLDNGSITVQNGLTPGITLFLDAVSGTSGSQVNVSMKAVGFTNINSIQGTIQFDPAVVTYSSISYFGLPGMNSGNFGTTQVSSGKLTFTWYDSSLEGINKADSTALFTIVFTLTCNPSNTSLNIVSTPTLVEVTDSLFNTLNTTVVSGSITNQSLAVLAQASSPVICNGEQSTLSATGAASFSWMPGSLSGSSVNVSPTTTTTYTVTGTSSGCTATSTVTVTVDPLPVAGFTPVDNGNGVISFTNSSQYATSYNWDFGDGGSDNTANPTHTYTTNGSYIVVLTAINSCGINTSTISVSVVVTNIDNTLLSSSLEIFPNPGNGLFNLKYMSGSGNKFTVKVINIKGEIVFIKDFSKSTSLKDIPLDFSEFSNGVYNIELNNGNETLKTAIIINK